MAEIEDSKSNAYSNTELEPNKGNGWGNNIISVEPNATVATKKIQKEEPEDS